MALRLSLLTPYQVITWTLFVAIFIKREVSGSQAPLVFRLTEELPAGTFVGNVKNDSVTLRRHSAAVLALLEFDLQHTTGVYAMFRLDRRSGVITTTQRVDREALYPDTHIELSIRVTPARHFTVVKVVIIVTDINDNPPTFPEAQVTLTIPESTRRGAFFSLPAAVDADGERYGVRGYKLYGAELGTSAPDSKFALHLVDHPDGSRDVKLVLLREVDYEEQDSYTFVLVATDGGSPALSGSVTILVTISDDNDNAPHFSRTQYETTVAEDAEPGMTLVVMAASDDDVGSNGHLTYLLDYSTSARESALFHVDNTTGAVLLAGHLDYDTVRKHTLSVLAIDGGIQPQTAFARVVINVEDVNDNAPAIMLHTLDSDDSENVRINHNNIGDAEADAIFVSDDVVHGSAEVMENSPSGTFIAQLTAWDVDAGEGGRVACYVDEENAKQFSLQRTSLLPVSNDDNYKVEYRVVTNARFDRETRAIHRVKFVCTDSGLPRLTSSGTLTVHVTDQNDNSPFFLRQVYHASVTENNGIGDIVTVMSASDQDGGQNAAITYFMSLKKLKSHSASAADIRDVLAIHPQTGVVRALVRFDYESPVDRDGYIYQVTASDNGQPARTAVTLLNVTIGDANDEYPVFTQDRYVFLLRENVAPPSELGTVTATDSDGPRYNRIVYSIAHQDGDRSSSSSGGIGGGRKFAIDSHTGCLVAVRALDREVQHTHKVVVQAKNPTVDSSNRDTESDIIASFVNVTIVVLDENDNGPIFKYPTPSNNTVLISNDVPVGYVIARFHAVDPDSGNGGSVTYAIVSGNDDVTFHVDTDSGELTTVRFLTSFVNNILKLTVSAQDSEAPIRSTLAVFYVHVVQRGGIAVGSMIPASASAVAQPKSFDNQNHPNKEQTDVVVSQTQQMLPTHLTFTVIVIVGVLGVLLVTAVSSIVLALLCLNNKRQRQRLQAAQEASKRVEEAAELLLLKATNEDRYQAASDSMSPDVSSLLWNTACRHTDNIQDINTIDILRQLHDDVVPSPPVRRSSRSPKSPRRQHQSMHSPSLTRSPPLHQRKLESCAACGTPDGGSICGSPVLHRQPVMWATREPHNTSLPPSCTHTPLLLHRATHPLSAQL